MFLIIVSLISGLLIFSYLGRSHYYLEEPLFLKNKVEKQSSVSETLDREYQLELYYLANTKDTKTVSRVEFSNEAYIYAKDPIFDFADSQRIKNDRFFDHYRLREVSLRIENFEHEEKAANKVLKEATIYFDDGSEQLVDLGEIHLKDIEIVEGPLELYSEILFDGTLEKKYEVHKEVTLTDVNKEHLDDLADNIEVKINDLSLTESMGRTFYPEDDVIVTTKLKDDQNQEINFTQINLPVKATFRDIEGNEVSEQIGSVINEKETYDFKEIRNYINSRKEE